ncbi:hypothetical protein L4174_023950 (plasmid) [Photobacterium sp. CCB-ST2H9]|uniref:hypothetical protein n=1 Tax=Photobacterium sp. CCB-ST2H9 TaxID=2912855 RepID=UPI002003EB35|nr:hypothetical protein [Photobacterium sp. CCB-ST2H9]UTM60441.1 hypothetical protein L4174_023950 [Photobacterium sp. CCB-ST2H9]
MSKIDTFLDAISALCLKCDVNIGSNESELFFYRANLDENGNTVKQELEEYESIEVRKSLDTASVEYGRILTVDGKGCLLIKDRESEDYLRFSDPTFSFGVMKYQ